MAQSKKSHAAPKLAAHASHTAHKATHAALTAAETTRNSAESLLKMGTDTAKEFLASSSEEAQKAHEKLYAISRESTQHVSRAVDAFTRTVNDCVGLARENTDAVVEVNHIAADIAKSINAELMSFTNTNFADNVELAKEAFGCRNINDAFELQSKWMSTNLDNFFSQTTRLAEMLFQFASEAAEPINERVAEATERLSKTLAA